MPTRRTTLFPLPVALARTKAKNALKLGMTAKAKLGDWSHPTHFLGFAMSERPKPDEKYTAYFSNYGGFLAGWLFYEQVIELLIKRELNLADRETSMVCSAMAFGVKFNLLLVLLRRNPKNGEGISLLNEVQTIAERNKVVHGFLLQPNDGTGINLVSRDIKHGKYVVKSKPFDPRLHMEQFIGAFERLQTWSGITDQDIDAYGRTIESERKPHPDQDSNHPESQTNSEPANQEPSGIFPGPQD